MASAAGAPVELYRPQALPWGQRIAPYRPLAKMGLWVLLLVASVFIATAIGR